MVRVEANTIVKLPVEEVFKSAGDPEIHLQWETSTVKLDKLSTGPMGKGTKHRGDVKFLGQIINWESEVANYIPRSKVEYNIAAGSMKFKEVWNFEEVEKNTKVTFIFEGNLQGLLRLISPIAVREWQKQANKDLATMKDILEAKRG